MSEPNDPVDQVKEALKAAGPLQGPALLHAVASVCYLMAAADGVVSEEETQHISNTLRALSESVEQLRAVETVFVSMAHDGRQANQAEVIADVAGMLRDPAQRRTVIAYAAGVGFADGHFDAEEEATLMALAEAFEITRDEAGKIIDKARGK